MLGFFLFTDPKGDTAMTHENRFGMFVHWGIYYAASAVQEQVFARMDWPCVPVDDLRNESAVVGIRW